MSEFVRVIRIKNANGEEKMLEIPAKLDLERPKRPRTVFSDEQLEKLEKAFTQSGYLCGASRAKLAETLGLSDNQVKVWFQNRRTKQKRQDSVPMKDDIPQVSPPLQVNTFSNYLLWINTQGFTLRENN